MEPEPIETESEVETHALSSPAELRRRVPAPEATSRLVRETRRSIRDLIHGRDGDRLLVVVGPCSIHDPDAAIEYASRLRRIADRARDELLIVMRTYLEKPRTSVGWKGLVNDPRLDGSCDLAAGLELGRRTLAAINDVGVPCGAELLDPAMPQYLGDLLAWASIGARTSQSQTHREMASGLAAPVGFKNGVDGDLDGAVNGIASASRPQAFVGIGMDGLPAVLRTKGNPDAHLVLRGGVRGSNYAPADVAGAYRRVGRPVLVDCSHDNSGRDPVRQSSVCRTLLDQIASDRQGLLGILLESNLFAGRQAWQPQRELRYGVSITDACIGWDETVRILEETAAAVSRARKRGTGARPVPHERATAFANQES